MAKLMYKDVLYNTPQIIQASSSFQNPLNFYEKIDRVDRISHLHICNNVKPII